MLEIAQYTIFHQPLSLLNYLWLLQSNPYWSQPQVMFSRFVSCWSVFFSNFIPELKIHYLYTFITLTVTLTALILAGRMPVIYELRWMALLSLLSQWIERLVFGRSWFWFLLGTQIFLCSALVSHFTSHVLSGTFLTVLSPKDIHGNSDWWKCSDLFLGC